METFKVGDVLKTPAGAPIKVEAFIAGGGQGEVYKVNYEGRSMALKWYKKNALNNPDAFYENLKKNSERGTPDKAFLWPVKVTEMTGGSFGYIMELRPKQFIEMSDLLLSSGGGGIKSFKAIAEACIEIAAAFRNIHKIGYSYQDMNSGNFFIDPATGSVLICDTDNIAPNGTNTGIIGTPQYMAPEIVENEARPSLHTDEFSLAVVLFMLLCASHPFEGARWADGVPAPSFDRIIYGKNAVFIFDPNDASNRPVKGLHNNVLKRWEYMPSYIKDLFIQAFSKEAINNPNKRPIDLAWTKALTRFQSDIVRCPACGNEIFIKDTANTPCDRCRKMFEVKYTLKLNEYSITAAKRTRIYRCQIGLCNADEALNPVAAIVVNPNNAEQMGLMNVSGGVITGVTPSGNRRPVANGEVVPLKKGIVLEAFDGKIEIN